MIAKRFFALRKFQLLALASLGINNSCSIEMLKDDHVEFCKLHPAISHAFIF